MASRVAPRPDFKPVPHQPCFCDSGKPFSKCCGSRKTDRPPPYGVGVVRDFVDADTCQSWIRHLRKQQRLPLGTVEVPDEGISHLESIRDNNRITDIVDSRKLQGSINRHIERAYRDVIAPAWERHFAWFEHPQVLRYESGGWYRAHSDSELFVPSLRSWAKGIDRDASLLLYLNDDFGGGELNFLNFHYSHRPRTGDLVFFPSDHRYVHQAEPVRGGVRWVVASWAAFENEPRVGSAPPPASILLD